MYFFFDLHVVALMFKLQIYTRHGKAVLLFVRQYRALLVL